MPNAEPKNYKKQNEQRPYARVVSPPDKLFNQCRGLLKLIECSVRA
jgi:hypothetical protein